MKADWPSIDAGLEVIIPFLFSKSMQQVDETLERAACLPRFDDHDQWDWHDPIGTSAGLAKKLGFPCNLAQHEQPEQVGKLFPLPIHSDSSNSEFEITVNRFLYVLWAVRAEELAGVLPPEEAMRQLQLMGEKLIHYFGGSNQVCREGQADQVKEWATYLRCTHGCYDLASGVLTDEGREIAALRNFNMNGGAA